MAIHLPKIKRGSGGPFFFFDSLGRDGMLNGVYTVGWRIEDDLSEPWSRRFDSVKRGNARTNAQAAAFMTHVFGPALGRQESVIVPAISSLRSRTDPTSVMALTAESLAGDRHDYLPDLLRHKPHDRLTFAGSRSARRSLVHGTYSLNPEVAPEIEGRRVVIVDDLVTNGDTIADIARALHEGEYAPSSVIGLAVAKNEKRGYVQTHMDITITNTHLTPEYFAIWDGEGNA